MGFEFAKESYTGAIKEISLGKGGASLKVGGESCLPFYQFEGDMPAKPRIAMEIWDMEPEDWPESVMAYFQDVVSDPGAWAKKCVEQYGAEALVLQLKSIDPNGKDAGADEAVATVKKVLGAVDVPLIVWGCANVQKDEEVLKKIAEGCQGENLVLGPVEDKNHKGIGASAMGFGHTVIASSPIDVNLAKQINILLENLGMPTDRMLIDPTTGGLGYGLEYTYSVMERIRMAAMIQGDDKLQLPIVNNLGNEIWKCKEAKLSAEEAPELGDPEKRGILMEAVGAVSYLMAGSDILIMRHPEAIRLAKSFIGLAVDGGAAGDVAPIEKKLAPVEVDLAALAPEPDLTIGAEPKAAAPKKAPEKPKAAEEKPAEKKPAAKALPPKEEKPPAPEPKPAEKKVDAEAEAKKAAEEKARAEAEKKAKAEAEEDARKAAEEKAKAEAEEKARKAAEEKAKAETEQKAKEAAKREAEEEAIRQKRAKEREERRGRAESPAAGPVAITAATEQVSKLDRMLDRLNRIHRRVG